MQYHEFLVFNKFLGEYPPKEQDINNSLTTFFSYRSNNDFNSRYWSNRDKISLNLVNITFFV